jgi:hypothetical protein
MPAFALNLSGAGCPAFELAIAFYVDEPNAAPPVFE